MPADSRAKTGISDIDMTRREQLSQGKVSRTPDLAVVFFIPLSRTVSSLAPLQPIALACVKADYKDGIDGWNVAFVLGSLLCSRGH
jgi:hypothetical protein